MKMPESKKALLSGLILTAAWVVIFSCTSGADKRSVKFQQYYVRGEQLYLQHCSNCHQKNGGGLGRVYPPLDTSDYMHNNFERVVCLIRYGEKGKIVVNGKDYTQPMPGVTTLTDLEIAEILTYIYNSWSHDRGIADVKDVSTLLEKCSALKNGSPSEIP